MVIKQLDSTAAQKKKWSPSVLPKPVGLPRGQRGFHECKTLRAILFPSDGSLSPQSLPAPFGQLLNHGKEVNREGRGIRVTVLSWT